MEIVAENYHPSFIRSQEVKSVFEFELPQDSSEHYNALHGSKYRELITTLEQEVSDAVKAGVGTTEAEYLTKVLVRIHDLAVQLDVKVQRK